MNNPEVIIHLKASEIAFELRQEMEYELASIIETGWGSHGEKLSQQEYDEQIISFRDLLNKTYPDKVRVIFGS